jgi:hypothetical protein
MCQRFVAGGGRPDDLTTSSIAVAMRADGPVSGPRVGSVIACNGNGFSRDSACVTARNPREKPFAFPARHAPADAHSQADTWTCLEPLPRISQDKAYE